MLRGGCSGGALADDMCTQGVRIHRFCQTLDPGVSSRNTPFCGPARSPLEQSIFKGVLAPEIPPIEPPGVLVDTLRVSPPRSWVCALSCARSSGGVILPNMRSGGVIPEYLFLRSCEEPFRTVHIQGGFSTRNTPYSAPWAQICHPGVAPRDDMCTLRVHKCHPLVVRPQTP